MTGSSGTIRNGTLALLLAGVAVSMIAMAYAAVPLYDLFCRVTGYGGTTQRADTGSAATLDRTIVVRFDANVRDLPWSLRPGQAQIELNLGETAHIDYLAANNGAKPTAGTATFNVTPDAAGAYFNKIECFCFTRQDLAPGESVVMPVAFFVSPDLDDDTDLDAVRTITLSYTFFPDQHPGQPVAQSARDETEKNM